MDAEGRDRLAAHLRWQAAGCARLGSALYGHLLEAAADDVAAAGVVAQVVPDLGGDLDDAAVGLRLMGAVHRLVLRGDAPGLARHYPSVGGTVDRTSLWSDFRAVVSDRPDDVREFLREVPQTNEVGRSAGLLAGLAALLDEEDLPVHLHEVGASAGLNLRADRYRLTVAGGASYGPSGSPVVLDGAWVGDVPGTVRWPRVLTRLGSDVAPVDPTTEEGRLRLLSYVWADQVHRVRRLEAALDVAAEVPVRLVRAPAGEHARGLRLSPGSWTVLWHSVMWQYLSAAEREAVAAALSSLGARATASARLAEVRLEPRENRSGDDFVVAVRSWPGGEERVVGTAVPHGVPVTWVAHR